MIEIAVDVRALQDPASICRGIGQHTLWIMREARRNLPSEIRLVAVEDTDYPPLQASERELFDVIAPSPAVFDTRHPAVFLQPAANGIYPQARFGRILGSPEVLKCVIIYDFIPWDQPHLFLTHAALRLMYVEQMAWTRGYDRYFPISEHSATRLRDLLAVDKTQIVVTGACLRPTLHSPIATSAQEVPSLPYFLCVFSVSPHKNPEAPVLAHARLNIKAGQRSVLVIAGGDPTHQRARISELYEKNGGAPGGLVFHLGPSDELLAKLYEGATALIAPSYDEGFCLPIVEALSRGCPVVASKRGSQPELVPQTDCHFEPDDHHRLESLMAEFLTNPDRRGQLLERQRGIVSRFTSEKVGERLWKTINDDLERNSVKAPAVNRNSKPVVAVVAPRGASDGCPLLHPQGIGALEKYAKIELHTDRTWETLPGNLKLNSLSVRPYLSAKVDRVISIVDGSDDARTIAGYVRWHGGPCIIQDADFLQQVAPPDDRLAILEKIAPHALPVMVHTRALQQTFKNFNGVTSLRLPRCSSPRFTSDELTPSGRSSARAKLGWKEGCLHILTSTRLLQNAQYSLGCLEAVGKMIGAGSNIQLHFIGEHPDEPLIWRDLVIELDLQDAVDLDCVLGSNPGALHHAIAGADLALFTGDASQPPPDVLMAGLEAGVHVVTNEGLAVGLDLPNHISVAPDAQFAPSFTRFLESESSEMLQTDRRVERREAYLLEHSYENYSRLLMHHLGF